MGKRHKSTNSRNYQNQTDINDLDIEMHALPKPVSPVAVSQPRRLADLGDRRRWAPGPERREGPREGLGRHARIVHGKPTFQVRRGPNGKPLQSRRSVMSFLKSHEPARFRDVRQSLICLRRKAKREVLFALKQTKSGAGSPKKRNAYSDVHC